MRIRCTRKRGAGPAACAAVAASGSGFTCGTPALSIHPLRLVRNSRAGCPACPGDQAQHASAARPPACPPDRPPTDRRTPAPPAPVISRAFMAGALSKEMPWSEGICSARQPAFLKHSSLILRPLAALRAPLQQRHISRQHKARPQSRWQQQVPAQSLARPACSHAAQGGQCC